MIFSSGGFPNLVLFPPLLRPVRCNLDVMKAAEVHWLPRFRCNAERNERQFNPEFQLHNRNIGHINILLNVWFIKNAAPFYKWKFNFYCKLCQCDLKLDDYSSKLAAYWLKYTPPNTKSDPFLQTQACYSCQQQVVKLKRRHSWLNPAIFYI